MKDSPVKVEHIYHSGFMVTLEKSILLFDWFTGKLSSLDRDKKLYVFCSHAHEDHYSPEIWKLQEIHPDVTYILDAGIQDAAIHREADIIRVEPHRQYMTGKGSAANSPDSPEGLFIRTLESTDQGVAFYIETEGKRIYHAGDLNVWFWFDEPMADNIASEKKCREEMQLLADLITEKEIPAKGRRNGGRTQPSPQQNRLEKALIDIAFVPLDPRLLEEAPRCIAAFMEILGADCLFPMHYWGREEEVRPFVEGPALCRYASRIFFDREKIIH